MMSNSNFDVFLGVKLAKNAKFCEIIKMFLAIFGNNSGHRGLKIIIVSYLTIIYNFCSISFVRLSTFFESINCANNNNNIDCSMVWASPQTETGS